MITNAKFPRTQKIGILVFHHFEPLDVWGFIEAFAISRFIGTGYIDPPPYPFSIDLISNEVQTKGSGKSPAPVKSYNGPSVGPDIFRNQAAKNDFDLIMIPGGIGIDLLMDVDSMTDPKKRKQKAKARDELTQWLHEMDKTVPMITSVCTGAALLAHSGLLNGKPATTNHQAFAQVTRYGPKVLWNNVSRWVDAGRFVTSAGVSAGTDMAFYLVERLAGRAVAETAAIAAEYDWHRNPEQTILYPEQAAVPSSWVE